MILTRDVVYGFIKELKGSDAITMNYINKRFVSRRGVENIGELNQHQELDKDPLANPLQVISLLIAQNKAIPINTVSGLEHSLSDVAGHPERSMHMYKVATEEDHP